MSANFLCMFENYLHEDMKWNFKHIFHFLQISYFQKDLLDFQGENYFIEFYESRF